MDQKIDFYTRKGDNTETMIDLLFTNSDSTSCERLEEHRITDHETILFKVKLEKICQMRAKRNITSWEFYTGDNLVNLLRHSDYGDFEKLSIEDKATLLHNNLVNAMSTLTYSKEISVKLMNKWYDAELSTLNKRKLDLYNIASRTGDWNEYNSIRRKYKKLIKIKKSQFMEHKILLNIGDSKAMWKHLKNCISMSKDINSINEILINDQLYTNESEIAQSLNNYFIDSIMEISSSIIPISTDNMPIVSSTSSFKFQKVTTEDILEIVGKFKHKMGGKKLVSEGVIKDSITYTGYFYSLIVNESLDKGLVPNL